MHVLLGLLVVVLLVYLFYRFVLAPAAPPATHAALESKRAFAFLSNGLIFYREHGGEIKQLQSTYAQEASDRRERAREKHSWKQGTSFNIAAGGGMRRFDQADKPLLATSVVFEACGSLLYFLKDEAVGGLFRRDAASGTETRVLLKQNLHVGDMALSPDGTRLAVSSQQSGGLANISVMQSDGSGLRDVTGGDTVDSAPAWIPGEPQQLLFQSSGLARNEQGYVVAQGHASIQILDMASGTISPVLDDPRFDYLKPRVCPAGNLLFIRRPFEAPQYGAQSVLLDTLFFPFRLLRAVFHYLNFFSIMYTRKPLTSASGPMVEADLKNILLQGRRIDAEKAVRSARTVNGVPSLVPDNWELVSRNTKGAERVLATNVASYDVSPDGTVVYTNGRGVFMLEKDGSSRLALKDALIADVAATAG